MIRLQRRIVGVCSMAHMVIVVENPPRATIFADGQP